MGQWILPKNLFKDSDSKDRTEKLFVDYKPDSGSIALLETGDEPQEGQTEYDLGWHLTITDENKLILVSHNPTEMRLTLKGQIGWDNNENILDDYCKQCYSSSYLGAEGKSMTPEIFAGLGKFLRETTFTKLYLLAKRFKSPSRLYMACVGKAEMKFRTLAYLKNGSELPITGAVRPIVTLPDEILLLVDDEYYDGSSPERGLQISIKPDELGDKTIRILQLRREIAETEQHLENLKCELKELENM